MGDAPPVNVTTLGGLVELKEQGNKRQDLKKIDRRLGYEALYELIDWTALEFFDDDRLIYLGATNEDEQPEPPFTFNSNDHITTKGNIKYFPRIDAMVQTGDSIQHSKSLTLQATQQLMQMQLTPQNYKIAESILDIMNLPNKKDIKDSWETQFNAPPPTQTPKPINPDDIMAGLTPEEQKQLKEHPEILDQVIGGK
jgi:hypothetical protein